MKLAALIAVLLTITPGPPAPRHDAAGVYLGFDRLRVFAGPDDRFVAGIIEHRYGERFYHNPVQIAEYGLWQFSRGRERPARAAADWLVRNQAGDGSWLYRFPFEADPVVVEPPWRSGMAQGEAIALLERIWRTTGEHRYLRAAVRALGPFGRDVGDGGVRRTWHGLTFFEEYTSPKPTGVLDGYLVSLIGLHDLATVSPAAARAWRAGSRDLARLLPHFDRGGHPAMSLHGALANAHYHEYDVKELTLLNRWLRSPVIAHYRDRWAATSTRASRVPDAARA